MFKYNTEVYKLISCDIPVGCLVAHAVSRSPPTAGVPSSHLGPSMWVSWWTKQGLGRFFTGFSSFPQPQISFHHFLHTHLIHFVSFHQPLWWCIRRGRPAPLLLTDLYYRGFIASHPYKLFLEQHLGGGKFFEEGFFVSFHDLCIEAYEPDFRILYRINVVKFVNIVIVLMMNYYYYLAREGPIWHGNVLRGKSVLLSLRNILIHHQN